MQVEGISDGVHYIGYDKNLSKFYSAEITSEGLISTYFQLDKINGYELKDGDNTVIKLLTTHSFSYLGTNFYRK